MSRPVVIAVVVGLMLAVGLYGVLRPGPSAGERPERVAAKLDAVPKKIGPWVGVDTGVSANALRVAEAKAHLSRAYTNEATNEAVTVLVLYGEPGDLGAHTPQVCYAGTGFDLCGSAAKRTLPRADSPEADELWTGRFEKNAGREALEVNWGWGVNGRWYAAENPRFTFADHRLIFKIYAQRSVRGDPSPPAAADPMTDFLVSFLRAFRTATTGPD